MTGPRLLVLWDIDNTLITADGFGAVMFREAFATAFGRELDGPVGLGGRTDLDIIAELLLRHDIEHTAESQALLANALVTCFENGRAELTARSAVLPGAVAALEAFGSDGLLHQGVLTGNVRAVAKLKLAAFGLDGHVDWDVSAYGDDHADRAELVTFARARTAAKLGDFPDDRIVLIGDTPNDVHAARTSGVRLIAVTTGRFGEDELRAAGAEVVLPGLTDLAELERQVWATA